MNTAMKSRSAVNTVVIGVAVGVLVAVPALTVAVASGGAGHGKYVAARALFPVPMLLTLLQGDRIGAFSVLVGLLQFPTYGALLGLSIARKDWVLAVVVIVAHIVAVALSFAGTLPNFS